MGFALLSPSYELFRLSERIVDFLSIRSDANRGSEQRSTEEK
jgi:hypothetical protein